RRRASRRRCWHGRAVRRLRERRLRRRPRRPADADLARLAELLNTARTVTLFCGIGSAGAHREVLALAEKLKAPVGYSLRGKQFVEHDNPYAVGMTGLLGWGAAYDAMHACDVLLL